MIRHVTAIFEQGVFKPLVPVDLHERDVVSLTIEPTVPGQEEDDQPLVAEIGDSGITWEQVQLALSKLPGSLSDDFERERDERFE